MVREDSNVVPVIVHVIGIAAGLLIGWLVMSAISPELPADDVDPGVAATPAPEPITGDDPESLLRAENLAPALAQVEEQLPAGESIITLRVTPTSVDTETGVGERTFELDDVVVAAPQRVVERIRSERPQVTLEDISYAELMVLGNGPQWLVQFDSAKTDVPPPWTYSATPSGERVTAGLNPFDSIGDR